MQAKKQQLELDIKQWTGSKLGKGNVKALYCHPAYLNPCLHFAQLVKNLPALQETWVRALGREDPLEKEIATHSSILAWEIPCKEKPGGLQSVGSQRVGHILLTKQLQQQSICNCCTHSKLQAEMGLAPPSPNS